MAFVDKVSSAAKKAKEATVKYGPVIAKTALESALYFLVGYGATAFAFDISGTSKRIAERNAESYKKIGKAEGYRAGYDAGFNDGQLNTVKVLKAAENPRSLGIGK